MSTLLEQVDQYIATVDSIKENNADITDIDLQYRILHNRTVDLWQFDMSGEELQEYWEAVTDLNEYVVYNYPEEDQLKLMI